jgi:hypothetical protein
MSYLRNILYRRYLVHSIEGAKGCIETTSRWRDVIQTSEILELAARH